MQFIVKPKSCGSHYYRKLSHFIKLIAYTASYIALFTTGIFIGILWNWDTTSCQQPTVKTGSLNAELFQPDRETFLVIIIFSSPNNIVRRDAIRDTWLKLPDERKYLYYFVIGTYQLNAQEMQLIDEESNQHHDLLTFNQVKDTYSGLSNKLLTSLKWCAKHVKFDFLLKVDDDSFVQANHIFDELVAMKKNTDRFYWGYFDGRAHVKRKGQWAEKQWFLCDRYLPYALGGGYVISSDLVSFIAKNSDLFQLYKSEDVSLGTWLSPLALNRVHDPRFDTEYKSRGCSNKFLVSHKQSVQDMIEKFENLNKIGKLCKKEVFSKTYYIYNWNVSPLECCVKNLTQF